MNDPEEAGTIFLEGHFANFREWNVERNFARFPIERIHPFAAGHPQRPFFVFACVFDDIAAKAERVVRIMPIADSFSGRGIKSIEAPAGSQPQHTRVVLADVPNWIGFTVSTSDAVVSGSLCYRIESIQELLKPDPERARTIFE